VQALQLEDKQLQYSVECSDGTTLKPQSLNEILDLLNPENRAITDIEISTRYDVKVPASVFLHLGNVSYFGTANYRISGDDRDVYMISGTIEDHIRPMIQRLKVPNLLDDFLRYGARIIGTAIFIVAFVPLAAIVFGKHLTVNGHAVEPWWPVQVVIFALLLAILGHYWGRISIYFFPELVFLIGAGQGRYEKMANLRRQLAWAVGAAFVVSIVVGYIFS
jgi:hypothetical protein